MYESTLPVGVMRLQAYLNLCGMKRSGVHIIFSRLYLSNGRGIGTIVVRLSSVSLS